jgi:4-hydroxyphenylpyruvate dioxygenase-like putative hemolysin
MAVAAKNTLNVQSERAVTHCNIETLRASVRNGIFTDQTSAQWADFVQGHGSVVHKMGFETLPADIKAANIVAATKTAWAKKTGPDGEAVLNTHKQ